MLVPFRIGSKNGEFINVFKHTFSNCPNYKNATRSICEGKRGKSIRCKNIIVTGGAQGMGFHIAQSLLDAGAGIVVLADVLSCRCQEAACKLNRRYGSIRAYSLKCDVSRPNDMEALFVLAKKKFQNIDMVVNNAGHSSSAEWDKTVAVNCQGVVLGTLLGFKYLGTDKGGKGGTIINISSVTGLAPCHANPVFAGSKHFTIGFSRSVGTEYFFNKTNVKVLTLCPGSTQTGHHDRNVEGLPEFPDLGKELKKKLGCLPQQSPEDVAVAFMQMLEDSENGSVWVAEAGDVYKCILPDRSTFVPPKEKPCKKAEPPKQEPKKDPCKIAEPPKQEPKKNPPKKAQSAKQEPPKKDPPKKAQSSKQEPPKKDPCKKAEPPKQEPKKDPCKKAEPPKKEPPKQEPQKDPCKKAEPPKEDPCKKDPCKKDEAKKDPPSNK